MSPKRLVSTATGYPVPPPEQLDSLHDEQWRGACNYSWSTLQRLRRNVQQYYKSKLDVVMGLVKASIGVHNGKHNHPVDPAGSR